MDEYYEMLKAFKEMLEREDINDKKIAAIRESFSKEPVLTCEREFIELASECATNITQESMRGGYGPAGMPAAPHGNGPDHYRDGH